ncbi:hypothetical protein HYU94_02455 [Candidatus Daviesbacteria bacterium]|nr:hypothetical protein [Candidatus Daviesbacteria bacterium]
MSFLKNLTAFLPFRKKEEQLEYFFAVNIGVEKITAALWTIENKDLKILDITTEDYSLNDEITTVVDKLLDQVLGLKEIEPQKILFGVPDSWILDDNLKDEYLKILRNLVKELELTPMAYVASSHALVHFLEKQGGIPPTAILIGFEKMHITVTVVRAGKIDGVKVIKRGENSGSDIEKTLLTFTDVETLPSKILIYGKQTTEQKSQLLSFSWMTKLSFLHFPKIETLDDDLEIRSVCLAGGSEINSNVVLADHPMKKQAERISILESSDSSEEKLEEQEVSEAPVEKADLGFVVGDIEEQAKPEEATLATPEEHNLEIDDFETDVASPAELSKEKLGKKFNPKRFLLKGNFTTLVILFGIIAGLILFAGAYAFLPKAQIKVFVEPKVLEKDAEVIADPSIKTVDENAKIIPGQIVEVEVSGTAKDNATGKKQIGDPAKGTVVIRNKTDGAIILSKGTTLTGNNQKFTLDMSVTIASRSADDGTWGKANGIVTAFSIGADGNISSGTDVAVSSYTADKIVAKSEGNFSGGTSKDVNVISNDDTQRLLAKLSSDLRQQAQQKLQEKYPNKKLLQEALLENIIKKNYNKNINDQAGEFSLTMTANYKGTAFDDADLRLIVSKLVTTQVPDGFRLDLSDTETQADVSKLEKNGKLIFLAKFKAKLMPKIDTAKIIDQIKFKTPMEAMNLLKGMDNVLGSEINITPRLPKPLERLPFFGKNIKVEVGLK